MSEGLGTHTPIRFGQAIERARGYHLRDYVMEEPFGNERYLLYVLYKRISQHWHGFILIQGARRAGKFTMEMGMGLHRRYPLHNARVRPSFAVDGVRERAGALQNLEDQWYDYRTQGELENKLRDLTEKVARYGFGYLYEAFGTPLVRDAKRTQDMINQWEIEHELYIDRPLGARFGALMLEPRAYEFIRETIHQPSMRSALGDLRPKLEDERWQSCLVYVMSSLLEMGDANEMSQDIYAPTVLDDEVLTLRGRAPFYLYLDQTDDFEDRLNRFAFFKALDMVESQIEREDRLQLQMGVVMKLRDDQ